MTANNRCLPNNSREPKQQPGTRVNSCQKQIVTRTKAGKRKTEAGDRK